MIHRLFESYGYRRGDKVKIVDDISEAKITSKYIGQIGTIIDIGYVRLGDTDVMFSVTFKDSSKYPDQVFYKEEIR